MTLEIRLLDEADRALFESVADDVFDGPVHHDLVAEFLSDPRHHICAAIDDGAIIGFASAVHYVHPDKPAELFINEVGVADRHRRRGIGRAILDRLLAHGKSIGCVEAWVLTDKSNEAARGFYRAVGGEESEHIMVSVRLT